jgi:very-short-patch-repair endonuclease
MPKPKIITRQQVNDIKLGVAKKLRQNQTPEEERLWAQLRRNQLQGYHFRRQQVIHGFVADFYCHAAGLVIELDGEIHAAQPEYDRERDQVLSGLGLRVLRFGNNQVRKDIDGVLKMIAEYLHKT